MHVVLPEISLIRLNLLITLFFNLFLACSYGSFGAGCTQTCHCQSGTCDIYTGVCTSGCEMGWSGVNCQGIHGVLCLLIFHKAQESTEYECSHIGVYHVYGYKSKINTLYHHATSIYYMYDINNWFLTQHSVLQCQ